jgi:hypothetical protein
VNLGAAVVAEFVMPACFQLASRKEILKVTAVLDVTFRYAQLE